MGMADISTGIQRVGSAIQDAQSCNQAASALLTPSRCTRWRTSSLCILTVLSSYCNVMTLTLPGSAPLIDPSSLLFEIHRLDNTLGAVLLGTLVGLM